MVRTELELELQDMRSRRRLCSKSFIICSLRISFSLISRSMVAREDTRQVSSAGFVSATEEGTSGVSFVP